jgi:hypothetical protein
VALVGYVIGAAAKAVTVDVRKYEHQILLGILWTRALVCISYFLYKRGMVRAVGRP